jgi:transposase
MWILCNVRIELPANGIHEYTPPFSFLFLNEGDVFGITYKTVVACLLFPEHGQQRKEWRTFSTMTPDLVRLRDWLKEHDCTCVAMESTGVFWKPISNLLEGHLEVMVVNAQHIKAVAGRKTDVKDAEWMADLLQHGLLRPSFIPPAWQRRLRDLTRARSRLTEERSRVIARLQKALEDANIKLASVGSSVMGASAQHMLQALVKGELSPTAMADLARGRMRAKREQLAQALTGHLQPHHCFLEAPHLAHIESLEEAIHRLSAEIAQRLSPSEEILLRLETIPGIKRRLAEIILAEIGPEMSRFPSAQHQASWAGMCPGNHESAGKR